MKIAIARLRSRTIYREPLQHIIDSFCVCLRAFVNAHPEHEYSYYNFSWGDKPTRDLDAIAKADVVIIPSESEFTYHIPGAIHTLDVKKSNEHIEKIIPLLKGKTIIILRSDRRDNEELYRMTLGNDWKYDEIDEVSFPNNIHSLKYYFIKDTPRLFDLTEKPIDFCYWGSDKRKGIDNKPSGDIRHKILKELKLSEDIKSFFIGRFYGFTRDQPMQKMSTILPTLKSSKSTICFNWLDSTATTSRYVEAVACGIIPFVWYNYDITGIFVKDEWQRVSSSHSYIDKFDKIRDNAGYTNKFKEIEESFLQDLLPKEDYISLFDSMLTKKL